MAAAAVAPTAVVRASAISHPGSPVSRYRFVNIQVAKGKTPAEAVIETHNKMIDIQIPLSDAETFGYTQRDQLPDAEYNEEKDITKIPDLAADSYLTCMPGMMAIFFPQDGHAPCIAGVPEIKKAIFKVKA